MSALTMFSNLTAARFVPEQAKAVSQVVPLLLAIALLGVSAVISVLIPGPMH